MYKFCLNFVLFIFILGMLICPAWADISKEEATDLVVNRLLSNEIDRINVHVTKNSLFAGDELLLINEETITSPYQQSWVYFVDDMPFAFWSHPCRYIFVDTATGAFQTMNHEYCPETLSHKFTLISCIPTPEPIVRCNFIVRASLKITMSEYRL